MSVTSLLDSSFWTAFGVIVCIPQPRHIVARYGHLTDYGQGVLINELTGNQDVTDPPAPRIVIPILLAISMVVNKHFISISWIQEGNLELKRIHIILVSRHFVKVDCHITMD